MTEAKAREHLDRVEGILKTLRRDRAAWAGSQWVDDAYEVAIVEVDRLAAKLRSVRLEARHIKD